MDQDSDFMAIPGEAARAIEADALLDVLQNLGVAGFVSDHEQAQSAVLQDLERLVIDVGARVGRPGDAERLEQLRDLARARGSAVKVSSSKKSSFILGNFAFIAATSSYTFSGLRMR